MDGPGPAKNTRSFLLKIMAREADVMKWHAELPKGERLALVLELTRCEWIDRRPARVLGWTAPDGIDCARMRSLQISNKGDRPWNRLAELAWIHRNIFSSFMG